MLVLYRDESFRPLRGAVEQQLRAIRGAGGPRTRLFNALRGVPAWLGRSGADVVVLHSTFLGVRWSELFERFRRETRWLGLTDCVKVALPQDDYDRAELLDEWLAELGVSDVFTLFHEHRALLYPSLLGRARFHPVLTGYIDETVAERIRPLLRPLAARPLDVVYRASDLPYRYGSHGQLKRRLAEEALRLLSRQALAADVSTSPEDVIVGERWLHFLASARATLGCESGSSALDRRGELERRIAEVARTQGSPSFEQVSAALPPGWDHYRFFTIGPRHLEAVVTRTPQILVEGEYQGILRPHVHYVPVRRDLSDLGEALERTRDVRALEALAEQAYEDVYRSGAFSYDRFSDRLRAVFEQGGVRSRGSDLARATAFRGVSLALDAGERAPRTLRRLLESPRSSAAKGLATARKTLASRARRRLVLDYLRDRRVRERVTTHELLADLLRLALLDDAGGAGGFGVRASCTGAELTLESTPASEPGSVVLGRLDSIVWDHSGLGSPVEGIVVGIRDRHRFDALTVLSQRHRRHVAEALAEVLRRHAMSVSFDA